MLCVTTGRFVSRVLQGVCCVGVWACLQVAGGSPRSCNAVRAAGAGTVFTMLDEQRKKVRALPEF